MIRVIRRRLEQDRIFPLVVIVFIVLSLAAPIFLTEVNLRGLLNQASVNLLVVAGLTLVLVCGHIDLSVGSTLALAGMVAVVAQAPLGTAGAAVLGVLCAVIVGLINGLAVAKVRVSSILATLASMIVVKGLALSIADRNTISGLDIDASLWIQSPLPEFNLLTPTSIAAILVIGVLQVALWQTPWGRTLYVIGGSDQGGRLSGIRTDRYLIAAFAIAGGTAGAAGVVLSLGLNTGSAAFGDATVFTVIAGAVVGGTSLLGAEGSVVKSALGVLVLAMIANAFAMGGVSTFILSVVTGGILLAVVLLDSYLGLRRRREWASRRIARADSDGDAVAAASA